MKICRRSTLACIGLLIALTAGEATVLHGWRCGARLVPARVTPLDSRHNNVWLDDEQRVVSYLVRYTDPKFGEDALPFFSGPILLRDPLSGETEVLVGAEVQNLKDHSQVVQRYLLPHYRETTSPVVRRYYLVEAVSQPPPQLPAWIPLEIRLWLKLHLPGMRPNWPCDDKDRLALFDAATELPIGTLPETDWRRQAAFAKDGSGFVLIYPDRCEWFNLPPQITHDNVWMKALLPPSVALALIALLRVRAIRRSRAPLKQPEGWTPTGWTPTPTKTDSPLRKYEAG